MNTLNSKRLKKAFGKDENGFSEIPTKISNVKISRIFNTEESGGCSYCFPHGYEAINSTSGKNFKSWKFKKEKQWSKNKKSYKAHRATKGGERWLNDGIERETWRDRWDRQKEAIRTGSNYPIDGYKWPYEK